MKIIRYKILFRAHPYLLEEAMYHYIKEGYQPYSAPYYSNDGHCQAIVKYEEEPKVELPKQDVDQNKEGHLNMAGGCTCNLYVVAPRIMCPVHSQVGSFGVSFDAGGEPV